MYVPRVQKFTTLKLIFISTY